MHLIEVQKGEIANYPGSFILEGKLFGTPVKGWHVILAWIVYIAFECIKTEVPVTKLYSKDLHI